MARASAGSVGCVLAAANGTVVGSGLVGRGDDGQAGVGPNSWRAERVRARVRGFGWGRPALALLSFFRRRQARSRALLSATETKIARVAALQPLWQVNTCRVGTQIWLTRKHCPEHIHPCTSWTHQEPPSNSESGLTLSHASQERETLDAAIRSNLTVSAW